MTLSFALFGLPIFRLIDSFYGSQHSLTFVRWTALIGAVLKLYSDFRTLVQNFDIGTSAMQFNGKKPVDSRVFDIYYALGVDGDFLCGWWC